MGTIKCIGILTSGGDAPGMNAAIRAVTRAAIYNGLRVKGIYRGYKGLVTGEIKEFKSQNVSNIIQQGGTILKTARCKEFTTPEGRQIAYDNMQKACDYVLVDGNRMPPMPVPGETIVKGDAKSPSIAAASILAKVSRDRVMLEYAKQYPGYHFEKHKGYGTKVHVEALREFGPCPIHRKTFLKKILG